MDGPFDLIFNRHAVSTLYYAEKTFPTLSKSDHGKF
jgi:hypothetical protein